MSDNLNADECWRAVQERDRALDGRFVYGVVTTGVFCRPSCPGRRALRQNVRFYATAAEAEHDGLRACLRCRPVAEDATGNSRRIQAACRYIEQHSDGSLRLRDLAGRAGLSPFHFQRIFRAALGLTPRQYHEAVRWGRLKTSLREAAGVADAVYEAGYGSSSRVYERSDRNLGMTPRQYRSGGAGIAITFVAVDTPLGLLGIGATVRGLCFVQFGDTKKQLLKELSGEYPAAGISEAPGPTGGLAGWTAALRRYLAGAERRLNLPLDIHGTAFRMRVWKYLQTIPYGETRSYGEVAAGIGQPQAVRAVASACANNAVALVIPCHRVIRGDGGPSGYRWGEERKQALLSAERAGKR